MDSESSVPIDLRKGGAGQLGTSSPMVMVDYIEIRPQQAWKRAPGGQACNHVARKIRPTMTTHAARCWQDCY